MIGTVVIMATNCDNLFAATEDDKVEGLITKLASLRMCRRRQSGINEPPKRVTSREKEQEAKLETKLCRLTNRIPVGRINTFLERLNDEGDTLLIEVIIYGWIKYAKCLIGMTADPAMLNRRNKRGQTALHIAILTKCTAIIRPLLVGGADLTVLDYAGNTPLHIAVANNDFDSVLNLTTIITAIECPELEIRRSLVVPQPPNIINYAGQTCLHIAAQHGYIQIAERLIQPPFNAAINIGDRLCGKTALHYAAEHGDAEFVAYLCSLPNIELFRRTYAGYTAIDLSIGRGNERVTRLLTKQGLIPQQEEEATSE